MKLMKSRFRLISLLLACAFLLAAVVCASTVWKQAGIALPPVQSTLPLSDSPAPSEAPAAESVSPPPAGSGENGILPGETDIPPDSEYNVFGL